MKQSVPDSEGKELARFGGVNEENSASSFDVRRHRVTDRYTECGGEGFANSGDSRVTRTAIGRRIESCK
jgi:hypothetical protein